MKIDPADDHLRRLCRLSYTIASAVWLGGPQTPEEKAAWRKKVRADKRAVDVIMAGGIDPSRVLSPEGFASLGEEEPSDG